MYIKRYSGLLLVSSSLFLPFALMSAALIHVYMRSTGRELLNAWQQSEAINIQEGNLLSAVANHKRVLLSSNLVTSLALVDIDVKSRPDSILSQFGDTFEIPELRFKNLPVGVSSNEFKGIFHEQVYFRFSDSPNLVLIFDINPSMAWSMFALLQGILFGLVLISLIFLALVIRREEEKRIARIKGILSSIVNSGSGAAKQGVTSGLPVVSETWLELKSILEDFSKEVSRNSRNLAIAEVTKSLAHDLRAPLGAFEYMLKSSEVELPSNLRETIAGSLKRLYSMIESLRFSELENITKRTTASLDLRFGHESLKSKADERNLELVVSHEKVDYVWIDPMKIERAWLNLAVNAIECAKTFVKVELHKQGKSLYIRVIDDGPGVPDEILPRLFVRGVTFGKPNGSGLGLAYVRLIAQGHGGDVNYKREQGPTIFELHIPNALKSDETSGNENYENLPRTEKKSHVQVISILLTPPSLASLVCSKLTAYGDDRYEFVLGSVEKANHIVTNDVYCSTELLERDLNVFDISPRLNDDQVVERLRKKFGISQT